MEECGGSKGLNGLRTRSPKWDKLLSLNPTVGVSRCVFNSVEVTDGWSLNWVVLILWQRVRQT